MRHALVLQQQFQTLTFLLHSIKTEARRYFKEYFVHVKSPSDCFFAFEQSNLSLLSFAVFVQIANENSEEG